MKSQSIYLSLIVYVGCYAGFDAEVLQAGDPFPITAAVLQGDSVEGVGLVTTIDNLAVNNSGSWLVEVDTNFPNTDVDGALLKDGVLFLQEGVTPLGAPAGSMVNSFDSITLNNSGQGGFNFFLTDLPSNLDSGVYLDTTLVIQEGDIATAIGLSPGTPYIGFFDVKINDAGELFIVASVDDPAIPTSVDRALIIVDPTTGIQSLIAKEGDILAGQSESVADFGTGPHESAFNNQGDVLFFADLTGDTSVDGTIYLNQTLIAQEGSPSPLAGRNYELLSSRSMALNDSNSFVFKANLTGDTTTDDVLIKDNMVFKQEGGLAPGGFAFTGFGVSSGPVRIDNAGNVLYFGQWNDPNSNVNSGLFVNDRLLVQKGVSQIGGSLVTNIASGQDAFAMSSNGRWVFFEATLENNINGAFLIELSLLGDVNCDGNVDLLDIEPFIQLIAKGGFSDKADINRDGVVDLLDVAPFVLLLTSG